MVVLSSLPPPTEGIRLEQPCTRVFVDNRELGKGTLFIAESCLSWVNSDTNTGFSLEYPHISLHAVSRDLRARPYECLYVMLDTCLEGMGDHNDSNEDDNEENDDEQKCTEMYFVPDDNGRLDAMFLAMNECQALHPDPEDVSDEEEFEDAEEDSEGEYLIRNGNSLGNDYPSRFNGSRNAANNQDAMEIEEGQFEDADSSPEN